MKKVLSALLALCLALGCFGAAAFAVYFPGDVDGDKNVSAHDARLALRMSVGLEDDEPGSFAYTAADYDNNGTVSAADARAILRVSVGLPAGEAAPASENNDFTTLTSGKFLLKGTMTVSDGQSEETEACPIAVVVSGDCFAVTAGDLTVLIKNDETYVIDASDSTYAALNNKTLRFFSLDLSPILTLVSTLEEAQDVPTLSDADAVKTAEYNGKTVTEYTFSSFAGDAGMQIVVRMDGDTLCNFSIGFGEGAPSVSVDAETVSAEIPAEMTEVPDGYQLLDLFAAAKKLYSLSGTVDA
ncbi:MAG: hypothetical protein IJJ85_03075 [Clostridia bacterium]|nr:hypothetical protein [Clostridia bacterium]